MSGTVYAEGVDVRALDRLVNAMRRVIEDGLPWYDRGRARERTIETERVRKRSIAARIRVEETIGSRYQAQDPAVRARVSRE